MEAKIYILDDLRESLDLLQERIDNPNAHWGVTSDLKECWNAISNAINEIESLRDQIYQG